MPGNGNSGNGNVVKFPRRHARAASARVTDGASVGYRSGRSSDLGTPVARSTAITRSGGTSSHWEIACAVTPIRPASLPTPPAASMARLRALLVSLMAEHTSIALIENQAPLHRPAKAELYNAGMTLGEKIKAARDKENLKQRVVAKACRVSVQAVSQWERDIDTPTIARIPLLAKVLNVSQAWLVEDILDLELPEIVELWSSMTEAQQARALRLVRASLDPVA
jgi:transcriptional regulator with XRE-family HTH domain